MNTIATGTVKENPEECAIGDWVLATGSNIEVQWLKEDEVKNDEIEVDYEDQPERKDIFRRTAPFGDEGEVWVRVK